MNCNVFVFSLVVRQLENISHFFHTIFASEKNDLVFIFPDSNFVSHFCVYLIQKPIIISIHESQNENKRIHSLSLLHTRQNIFAMWYWHFNNSIFFLWFFLSYSPSHCSASTFCILPTNQPVNQQTNKQTNDEQTLPTIFFCENRKYITNNKRRLVFSWRILKWNRMATAVGSLFSYKLSSTELYVVKRIKNRQSLDVAVSLGNEKIIHQTVLDSERWRDMCTKDMIWRQNAFVNQLSAYFGYGTKINKLRPKKTVIYVNKQKNREQFNTKFCRSWSSK